MGKNVLTFGNQVVKELCIVSSAKLEVNSIDELGEGMRVKSEGENL